MQKKAPRSNKALIAELQSHIKKLQAELKKQSASISVDANISVKVLKKQERFKRIRDSKGEEVGIGEFFFQIDVTAAKKDVYIPLSIASGKKSTGFVYQIEGTAEGSISTTDISSRGEGVTQITLGTILYCKIPALKKASFRILIETRGKISKSYKIVINCINYKFSPTDARYKKFTQAMSSNMIRFR